MTKKIVITGVGATTPIGGTARDSWNALLAGESGARTLEAEWVEKYDLPVTFAATAKVPAAESLERHELNPAPDPEVVPANDRLMVAGNEELVRRFEVDGRAIELPCRHRVLASQRLDQGFGKLGPVLNLIGEDGTPSYEAGKFRRRAAGLLTGNEGVVRQLA